MLTDLAKPELYEANTGGMKRVVTTTLIPIINMNKVMMDSLTVA
jgi:hypothetical protein